jgi:hypothetical protein
MLLVALLGALLVAVVGCAKEAPPETPTIPSPMHNMKPVAPPPPTTSNAMGAMPMTNSMAPKAAMTNSMAPKAAKKGAPKPKGPAAPPA